MTLAENIAKEYGFTVVERYIDNGISGSGFKNRSEIQRMLVDAKRKKFDVVIAKSVSRLGRNTLNSMQLADQLERIPIRLILPEDSYDTDTSKSRLMFNLKAILAEDENAKIVGTHQAWFTSKCKGRQSKGFRTTFRLYGKSSDEEIRSL
ncbi:recombinase family protein [Paenibacillus taichungensis]|uniref:recombinase family protein n=1 Tax=Paenibacillus taichungensis TaxID=484184 RepID=UPI0038168396